MTRVLIASLTVFAAVLFGAVGCQDQQKGEEPPKEVPQKEVPKVNTDAEKVKPPAKPSEAMEEMLKRYAERQRRQHGAKMSITAAAKAGEDGKPEMVVKWEIEYDGPRPPLTILPPDLQMVTNEATKLYVYYETASGKLCEFYIASPSFAGPMVFRKEQFATPARKMDEKGVDKVTGEIVVRAEQLINLPEGIQIESVAVQLRHWANQRGESDMDAWTGELMSNVARVSK